MSCMEVPKYSLPAPLAICTHMSNLLVALITASGLVCAPFLQALHRAQRNDAMPECHRCARLDL